MERVDAAVLAEQLLMPLVLVDVFRQVVFAADKSEIGGPGANEPQAKFEAGGAIAFAGAAGEIDVGFVLDCAAQAASVVLFGGHCICRFELTLKCVRIEYSKSELEFVKLFVLWREVVMATPYLCQQAQRISPFTSPSAN
jgi:hypothetical protein